MQEVVTCTWVDCKADGTKPQVGSDGSQWAKLCEEHDQKLEAAIATGDVKKWMGAYIKAQGGAKAAAARMAPGAAKGAAAIIDAVKAARRKR